MPPSAATYAPLVRHGIDAARPAAPANTKRSLFIGIGVVLLLVAGSFFALRGGGGHAKSPEILPPQGPAQGLPGSLSAAVRIQAESSRRTAMQAVMSSAAPGEGAITVQSLAAEHANLDWIDAKSDSRQPGIVSFQNQSGVLTIAVGAKNGMCAFGRWTPPAQPRYVTMANVDHCRAEAAPTLGWSAQEGGSAGDLPDETP